MINGKNVFDQPVKNDIRTYDKIQKIVTGQGDDYTTGCLLEYVYLKNYYKMIAIDLSKQQALDADPQAIYQITFTKMSLAKSVLVSLALMAAVSATDAGIQKKIFGSGTTTLIFSNKDLNDMMKVVNCWFIDERCQ